MAPMTPGLGLATLVAVEGQRPQVDSGSMVVPVLLAAGFVFGFAVGRWWALVGAAFVAIVGLTFEVEVSPVVLGVGYGLVSALAIAVGVAVRRVFRRRMKRRT